jgi:hypothetical protein
MNIKRYAILKASMRGMNMGMVFTKSMRTRWRASGHYCVVGYVHTGEFRRSTCRIISAFLNSYTTQGREVNRYSKVCYRYSFHHPASQHEPNALATNWRSSKNSGHAFAIHGEGAKNTVNLRGRASGKGQSQGQWLNNEEAARFLSNALRNTSVATVRIPAGLGHVIKPDGTIVAASWARVLTSVSGIRTAYPIIF